MNNDDSPSLRSLLFGLQDLPGSEIDNVARRVVDDRTVSPDGSLEPLSSRDATIMHVDLSDVPYLLPYEISSELQRRYDDSLTDREYRLVVSGVELAMTALHRWIQISEGTWDPETERITPPATGDR